MRASRLVELLVRLQLRGSASATALAEDLGVSVRTVYRDVAALSAAGVPIWTEVGRLGGVRIDPSYRVAGLPRLDPGEARSVLFAVVPAIADQLGMDVDAPERTLLPAMERTAEAAARVVRDRLLVEPTHWFLPPDPTPALADVARAVWETREVALRYRGDRVVAQPLGLILKGDKWYLLGRTPTPDPGRDPDPDPDRSSYRLFRVSRIEDVDVRPHTFTRPDGFELATQWSVHRDGFLRSIPEYAATVRVSPAAEPLLRLLEEGRPPLPLPPDVERDEHGWARVTLRFERPERAARQLLRLGAGVEVLGPPELRRLMAETAAGLVALYAAD